MKPTMILSEIEREAIVYFGCTWSEIQRCIRRGGLVAFPFTVFLMVFMPGSAMLWLIPGLLSWLGLFLLQTRTIRKYRAGKPLYYERHRKEVKRAAHYIRHGEIYQVYRTDTAQRKADVKT